MNFDFPMVKEKIAKAEKDFEKSKRDISKKLNNYKISHQDLSPLSGKIQEIFSVIDINTFDIDIKSKIISLLGDIDSKKNLIYNKVLEKIKKREKYLNQKLDGAKKSNHSEAIREINNELKNITMEKKSLDDSKKSIESQTNLIETFCNDTNKTSQDLKKLNDSQSRRVAGVATAAFVGSSVLGPEGAAILGGAYKLARTIGSKSARKEMFQNIKEQGFGGIASKTVMGVGAYLGSPGIVGGGALMNEHFSKSRDVKNKSKSVLNSLNKITADNGMSGIAHGPTIAGLAMDGKPESFKFTPGKSSVNGVELNQSGSKGIVEELKRTNTLLDQNNDILKSLLGISKDTLEFQQDEDKEDELKHKEGKKAEFKGFDVKTEKKKEEEEEDKKGFFAKLKSSVIGFARSLIPSTGVGFAKLGGGIAGGGLGAYGGFKAGKWASSKLGLEEGGTGEKIMEYGGAAAGLAGGAWAGSKLAGKIAGSKFFRKTGLGKLAGGLGGMASAQIARAEADQKVYVTNASEIGEACKGGGGILDGAMDMFGGKKGKLASKLFKGGFGRSATRLAAKVGGRGFAKTTSNILGKGAGLLAKSGGLLAEGGGLIGKLGPMLGGMAKFAGPVGLALTAGSALYSGFKGWKNAGDIAGLKPGEKATTGQKVGASVAGVLSSLSMGFIDPKTIYTFGSKLGPSLSTAMLGPLGLFFRKKEKNADDLHKKEADLMKDKENENKDFFDKLKPDAGAAGGGILGGFFDKLKDTTQAAKQAYSSSREQGGSFFESLGAAKKSGKEVISGKASENRATLLAEMSRSGITDKKEQAMFMGQMRHESGGFAKMSEGKYSAEAVWKLRGSKLAKQGITLAQLKAEEKSQGKEAMWERMYGGRMGNKAPGDGIKYRGRGFVQLTGKSNYAKFGKLIGVDLVNNPDLASDPKIAARIATAYWKDRGLGEKARRGDLEAVTRGIQGGTLHMAERGEAVKKELALLEKGGVPAPPAAVAKPEAKPAAKPIAKAQKVDENGQPVNFGDATEKRQNTQKARMKGDAASQRGVDMPDGTRKMYSFYSKKSGKHPTQDELDAIIKKDQDKMRAKMAKKGGSETVVHESKANYSGSEGAQLKRAEESAAKNNNNKQPQPIINNVTNNSTGSSSKPHVTVSSGDVESYPARLSRSY